MGKSKKKKQQDFQKVKLKVGKKLKKGENVTDASFKSRTIQITQQLKTEKGTGPTTKKKQNIRDVLVQCRHYNANVRQEAVAGLKDIVTGYPEVITSHLSDILEKSSELLSDKEPSVRQGSLRLFKAVFPKTPEKQIKPFFSMVCAHLCCAMTHIYSDIQMDSLNMFDLLLENYPVLMISHSNQVMVNFIEQISRQNGQGEGQGQRSLSTNLGQKVTSMKWRGCVLGRIEKFLTAFLQCHRDKQPSEVAASNVVWFDESEQTHIVVYPKYIRDQWENPGYTLRSIQDTEEVQHGLETRFPEFIDTLLPLLLECWVEASPTVVQTHEKDDSVLTTKSIVILSSILNVTKLLLECVDRLYIEKGAVTTYKVKSLKDLLQRLFNGFPYGMQETWGFTGRKNDKDNLGSIAVLNLTICEILTYCLSQVNKLSDLNLSWLWDSIFFTSDFLKAKDGYVGTNCKTVAKIARKLIKADIKPDKMTDLVSGMFSRFKRASPLSQEKKVYLQFFSDIVFDPSSNDKIRLEEKSGACFTKHLTIIFVDDISQQFLQCLPELFPLAAKESPRMVPLMIQSLKVAASRDCLSFLNSSFFEQKGVEWFGVKDGAVISLPAEDQRELFSLLYFIRDIDVNMIKLLTQLVRSDKLTDRNVAYLIQVLHNRFQRGSQTESECSLHVSFLASLLLGDTHEGSKTDVVPSLDANVGRFQFINCDQDLWTRQELLVQEAIKVVHLFENSHQVKEIMLCIAQRYLENHSTLGLQTVLGILTLTSVSEATPTNMIDNLAHLGLSTLALCTNCNTEPTERVVYSLHSAVCQTIRVVPEIFLKSLLEIHKLVAESPESQVILLLRVCLLILREEHRIGLLKITEAVGLLKQIIQTVKSRVHKSSEVDTLIADLEYRCSTQSFSVT